MNDRLGQNPRYVFLSQLIKRLLIASAALLVLFVVAELAEPNITRLGEWRWLTPAWLFGSRCLLGLAVGALLIALLLLQQRSTLGRR